MNACHCPECNARCGELAAAFSFAKHSVPTWKEVPVLPVLYVGFFVAAILGCAPSIFDQVLPPNWPGSKERAGRLEDIAPVMSALCSLLVVLGVAIVLGWAEQEAEAYNHEVLPRIEKLMEEGGYCQRCCVVVVGGALYPADKDGLTRMIAEAAGGANGTFARENPSRKLMTKIMT